MPEQLSLTRIRDRLGEEMFRELFAKVIEQCRTAGLVPGKRVIADGTLVVANAALYSLVKIGEDLEPKSQDAKHRKRGRFGKKSSQIKPIKARRIRTRPWLGNLAIKCSFVTRITGLFEAYVYKWRIHFKHT